MNQRERHPIFHRAKPTLNWSEAGVKPDDAGSAATVGIAVLLVVAATIVCFIATAVG